MTMKMEDLFDLLHRTQAEKLLSLLENPGVTAQELNAINRFLSDNNVTGIRAENTALNKLSDGLDAYNASQDNVVPLHA